ncbi:GNAT family N-acetyltransferase [Leifsonia aquatica]|uniref:Acetyltransferase, GNAT family n=2 Tax=Leifsonia aquatica TaxID=144185 RepID=U2RPP8_LEIAQ|nr:GNAT family N-acetyltransferase [Leifsonia aquatica]ERK70544.1 acetyltransferase, GNAT family [Leifsonia aquatica ATCC 14665]MBB2968827.1 RimJ/RimL family protein N-acetyltransferase [Leifsonia aquatica]
MALAIHRPRVLRGPALDEPLVAPVLGTDRLLLRPYRAGDAVDWLAIEADDGVRSGLGWPERTERQALDHFRARMRHTVLSQAGDFLALAVELDDHVIGDVSLHLRTLAVETRSVEIGWLQRSDRCGQGYATEAAEAALDLAFGRLGAVIVTAVVDRTNERSARLAGRLGFRLAGGTASHTTWLLARAEHPEPIAGFSGRIGDRRRFPQ